MRLVFCCLFLGWAFFAQASNPSDSLLAPGGRENLVFYGPLEKMVFTTPQGAELADRVRLFLASSKDNAFAVADFAQNQLHSTLRKLESARAGKKTRVKDLDYLHQTLKSRYFRRYNPAADFGTLFKSGDYNEYTSTALYIIVLDHLGYTYRASAGLEHINLTIQLADGEQSLDKVLPTWGGKGNDPATDYLDLWQELSLIPKGESRQSLARAWAERYDQKDGEKINPFQLAGLLYYRRAGVDYADRQFLSAIHALEKARFLYPTPLYEPFRATCRFQLAANLPMDSDRLGPLFDLYAAYPNENVRSELIRRFAFLAEHFSQKLGEPDRINFIYHEFQQRMGADLPALALIKEIYYIEQAQYYASTANSARFISYMDTIYQLRPNDQQVQDILSRLLVRSLGKRRDYEACIDVLGQYKKQYPFLAPNPHFRDLELFYRSERIKALYDGERPVDAGKELETFERMLAQSGPTPRGVLWITTAYAAASYYYFRQKDFPNARLMIARGLTLAPGDAFLMHRSAVLLNY